MDAERHLKEKERLNQALNGNLAQAVEDVTAALRKNNIDYSPRIAFDVWMCASTPLKNCI